MMLRNLMIAALLLGVAGCGCNDDSPPLGNPGALQPSLVVKTQMPAIPIDPPSTPAEALKVDVMFVLDDSDAMNDKLLGVIPNNLTDARERTQAAQAIMRRIEQTVAARLANEYTTEQLPVPSIDFAYGVSRYEDFGGGFTSDLRRNGPIDGPDNDQDARPFILNMPLLRQNHPQFAALFGSAMSREAPGDGNPYVILPPPPGVPPPDPQRVDDPQTAIEALYQLAAPQNGNGTYGGFDANGDGDTTDSGQPTSLAGALNPQTAPGSSGDVPAIGFQAIDPTDADYSDPDGEPLFRVRDENGVIVTNGRETSIASGNIGGAGWRENSVRFIILASDIATVAPMRDAPTGTAEDPVLTPRPGTGVNLDLSDSQTVSSSDGAPDAPREPRTVLTLAFDGGAQVIFGNPSTVIRARRTGTPGGAVSPTNAHTIEDAIEALNALDVEVLLLGSPTAGGLDTKPGDTGVNGDRDSDIPADDFDPSDLTKVQSNPAPWFWMNAVSRLTTPEITSIAPSGAQDLFPGVYNLGTVWPFNPADVQGADESNIKNTVTDDLVERIRGWIDPIPGDTDSPYKTPTPGGVVPLDQRPALPTAVFKFDLNVEAIPANEDVIQIAPGAPDTAFAVTGVQIPTYWSDQTPPADVEVEFPTDVAGAPGPLTYARRDEAVVLPASRTVDYTILATFQDAFIDPVGQTSDAPTQQKIRQAIIDRGDGTGGTLPTATTEVTVSDAQYVITVRSTAAPGQGVVLGAISTGCAIVAERTFVPNFTIDTSDQQGGTCPFPPNTAP
ncbi:MAG: hypothetical protein QNJ90_09470 [Planctomycetota bacterium]|nr:hypothetical protein [Planctomycetota bacterium]